MAIKIGIDPVHPGIILKEMILQDEDGKWINTMNQTAALLGMSAERLSSLLEGRVPVTPEIASAIEKQGWGSGRMWLNMQHSYDTAPIRI